MLMAASAGPCLTALHRAALRGDLAETRALLAAVSVQAALCLLYQIGLAHRLAGRPAGWAAHRTHLQPERARLFKPH